MIKSFIERCECNKNKDAFRYIKNNSLKSKTFKEMLDDIYRICNLLKEYSLKQKDKVILFIEPSYEMYCLLFAGIIYGINIIVIDSFKNKKKLKYMIQKSEAKYVFVNQSTKLISKLLFNNLNKIDITYYYKMSCNPYQYNIDSSSIVLTTFTSGTTGFPKLINRSFEDFQKQIDVLKENYDFDDVSVIICMLPIYVLFSLFHGHTTCLIQKLSKKNVELLNGDVLLGKIVNVLKLDHKIERLKEVYLGGAYIYKKEAKKIINVFPNAKIHYTYGASEGVVIGKNTLTDFYKNSRFKIANDVIVEVSEKYDDVGEIVISGQSILGENKTHYTGDIGYLKDNYIYLLGRKKYSSLINKFYNYSFDEQIRQKYNLDKAFSIWYNGDRFVFVEKKIKTENFIKVRKIPYDLKHQTKADYNELIVKYLDKYLKK